MREPRSNPSAAGGGARVLVAACLAGVLCACAGDAPAPAALAPDSPLAEAPAWVVGDCSSFWTDDDDVHLCGVGSVAGTRNISLARTAAIGRARARIARELETRVRSMLADYAQSPEGAEALGAEATDARYLDDVSKQITRLALGGSALAETWVGPDGTLYTLVGLDLDHFRDSLDQMTSLSEDIREAVKDRSEDAFRAPETTPRS
jgi:hypothetical protein